MNKKEFIEYLMDQIDSDERIDAEHQLDDSIEDGLQLYWEDEDMHRGFYMEPKATGFRIHVKGWRPQVSSHKEYLFSARIGRINVERNKFAKWIADELFEMALSIEMKDLEKIKRRRATTTEIHWEGDDFKYVNESDEE